VQRTPPPNFGVKLMRPGFGPAAELPTASPARWRHGGCSLPLGSLNVIGGNRRAAQALARGTGRTAYTKDVSRTKAEVTREATEHERPELGGETERAARDARDDARQSENVSQDE
jgi:hypothetical protein